MKIIRNSIFRIYYFLNRFKYYSEVPVFIVGCGHSGTTLMLQILGNHPDLFPIPFESYLFYEQNLRARLNIVRKFYSMMANSQKKRWVEKTPKHILKTEEIRLLFPKSKVIIMVRDGRDVVCSLMKRGLSIEKGLKRWTNDNQLIPQVLNDSSYFIVRLEDLQKDSNKALKAISDYLNISIADSMYDYYKTPVKFFSNLDVNKLSKREKEHIMNRINQTSQPIRQNTSIWRSELTESQKEYFKIHGQDLLELLGYEQNNQW